MNPPEEWLANSGSRWKMGSRPLEIGDRWVLLVPSFSEKGKQVALRVVDHWRMGPSRAKANSLKKCLSVDHRCRIELPFLTMPAKVGQ